jgi:hypothetical protein
MLARRDWGETRFQLGDLGSRFLSVEEKIGDEDTAFLVVCPSSIEIAAVEKLCTLAGDRPVLLLIPQLEDVAIVGIGYAARQLRERFLSTLETAYYFRPLEGATVFRAYPSPWQVWLEKEEDRELIAEESGKPLGEHLETLILRATGKEEPARRPGRGGLFAGVGKLLKALRQ